MCACVHSSCQLCCSRDPFLTHSDNPAFAPHSCGNGLTVHVACHELVVSIYLPSEHWDSLTSASILFPFQSFTSLLSPRP